MTQAKPPTIDGRRAARAALRRHAFILLAIILVGVLWLAVVAWLGYQAGG